MIKKVIMFLVDILICVGIGVSVYNQAISDSNKNSVDMTAAFDKTTRAVSAAVNNYVLEEQKACDAAAAFINSGNMTVEEAISFLSSYDEGCDSHIVCTDTLKGVSTSASWADSSDYSVSYEDTGIITPSVTGNTDGVNITESYVCPGTDKDVVAFCRSIKVKDSAGKVRDALLMRVISVSSLRDCFVYPDETYSEAKVALISADGRYITKPSGFKNSDFYDYISSYNAVTAVEVLKDCTSSDGTFTAKNSMKKDSCFTHVRLTGCSTLIVIGSMELKDLGTAYMDWNVVFTVISGLGVLVAVNGIYYLMLIRKINKSREEARNAEKAKSDFLSLVSHDIRTPLNAIMGFTSIAGNNTDDKENVKDCLHKIDIASETLLTLISDILDITNVENGSLKLVPSDFSLSESAANLVNLVQAAVREKNIDLKAYTEGIRKEMLCADNQRVNQIFSNLLTNAVKYTDAGGNVRFIVREELSDDGKSASITFIVEDNGMGMSPEFLERMYTPFAGATDSGAAIANGTGFGLAITKQMVDLMNGTIECFSEKGKGTKFTVMLEIPVSEKEVSYPSLKGLSILIADTDENYVENFREILADTEASVDFAYTGSEALKMAVEKANGGDPYDAVITERNLSDISGIEIAGQINKRTGGRTSVILTSVSPWSEIDKAAEESGIAGFIQKPVFTSSVCEKITAVLSKKTETKKSYDGINVLIAEDNDLNWEIVSEMLEIEGITSERAVNGKEAVEMMSKAEKGRYALIFMDIRMPEMNGIEATKIIRAGDRAFEKNIPIYAMTADAYSENIAECMSAGMNGHIAKPVDMKQVMRAIDESVDN